MLALISIHNLVDSLLSPLPTTLAQLLQADMPPSKPALIDWLKLAFAPVAIALDALEKATAAEEPQAPEPAATKEEISSGIEENAIEPATTPAPAQKAKRSKKSKKPAAKPMRETNFAAGEHLHPRERATLEVMAIIHELNWFAPGADFPADESEEVGAWIVAADHYNLILELRHIEQGDRWLRYLPVSADSHYEFEQFCRGLKAATRTWDTLRQIEIEFPAETAQQPAPQPEPTPEPLPLFQLKMLSEKVGYFIKTDDGQIICAYAGFANKRTAKSWGDELLSFPQCRYELREAKRLNCKWELKIKGLSLKQIEKLAEQDLSKPREKQCAGGRLDKSEPQHPLSDEQAIEQGERAKADIFPPAPQPTQLQQPKYGDLMRHVESGFIGSVTASTPKGGILKDANGDNKWVIWTECKALESLAVGF